MKKFGSILLALTLALGMLTACGDKAESSTETVTSVAPSSSQAVEEPEELPYTPNTLTGLPWGEDYNGDNRILAVMVANHAGSSSYNARPQWGLSSADMLVEIKAEGGITRFMALFADYTELPKIGPVRSARDQFFQLILPWQALYVHIGESTVQSEYRVNYNYNELDINLDKYGFSRDQDRINLGRTVDSAAYTDLAQIQSIIDKTDVDMHRNSTSTFFDFVNYNEPNRVLTGDDAIKIDIQHSASYRTYFTWDAEQNKYMMSQYSAALGTIHDTVDANNNEQLGFENVIVLFTDIHRHPAYVNESYDIQQVDYAYGGVGYYFNGGKAEPIRWLKGTPDSVLRIVSADGTEESVQINPGKTYLGIVDLDEVDQDPGFQYYRNEADIAAASGNTATSSNSASEYVESDQ